MHITACILIK